MQDSRYTSNPKKPLIACRWCHSVQIRRSQKRNLLERMIGVIALPYRCKSCDRRFFYHRFGGTHMGDSN